MTQLDLRGFNLFPSKVTFEKMMDVIPEKGPRVPCIRVGYKSEVMAMLYQYLNDCPSKDGMLPGQWYAIAMQDNLRQAINLCVPAGRSLEELKKFVKETIIQHYGA